ncbi:hypothetical protein PIB30_007799 [Stylosanthes scabra]|uniref:Helicase XPB/Ssl2 N-terminal domain-containing protein n=1 Tax=Stylosanthes scabra TaxID=79078 RepID=A0ABU6Z4D9_9FABA|nr:hypothetical protein [Stylosanthes scabra]
MREILWLDIRSIFIQFLELSKASSECLSATLSNVEEKWNPNCTVFVGFTLTTEDDQRRITDDDDVYGAEKAHDDDEDARTKDFSKLELKPETRSPRSPFLRLVATAAYFWRRPLLCTSIHTIFSLPSPSLPEESMHEYNLTPHSLYAAVSVGLETETIMTVLNKLSKIRLPAEMIKFIHDSAANYGKVKLVLKKNRYFVESPFPEVLKTLLKDETISRAMIVSEGTNGDGFTISKVTGEIEGTHDELFNEAERSSLAGSVLYLKSLDLPDIYILKFDFLDPPPSSASLQDTLRQLHLIDAIDENGAITSIRQKMAAWQPCNPVVGGPVKSQLVHEVDPLVGEIEKVAYMKSVTCRSVFLMSQ